MTTILCTCIICAHSLSTPSLPPLKMADLVGVCVCVCDPVPYVTYTLTAELSPTCSSPGCRWVYTRDSRLLDTFFQVHTSHLEWMCLSLHIPTMIWRWCGTAPPQWDGNDDNHHSPAAVLNENRPVWCIDFNKLGMNSSVWESAHSGSTYFWPFVFGVLILPTVLFELDSFLSYFSAMFHSWNSQCGKATVKKNKKNPIRFPPVCVHVSPF